MEEKYITRVDKVCKYCGYRNISTTTMDKPLDVVACGKCSKLLIYPDGLSEADKDLISRSIRQAAKKAIEDLGKEYI